LARPICAPIACEPITPAVRVCLLDALGNVDGVAAVTDARALQGVAESLMTPMRETRKRKPARRRAVS